MCARPISSLRALLRVCTRGQTHPKRLAAGVLTILWAIGLYKPLRGSSTSIRKKLIDLTYYLVVRLPMPLANTHTNFL